MLKVTTCNSLLAIFAGLLSDLLVQGLSLGPLAPFLAALVTYSYTPFTRHNPSEPTHPDLPFTEHSKGHSDQAPPMFKLPMHQISLFLQIVFPALPGSRPSDDQPWLDGELWQSNGFSG